MRGKKKERRLRIRRWLYPSHCALCDRLLSGREEDLCAFCRPRVRISCLRFENGVAPFPYRGIWRDAVRRFKYSGRAEYAGFFAKSIVCALAENHTGAPWRPDVLVPVPVHPDRFRERGYNQAEELAKKLSNMLHVPCETGLVIRVKNTRPQNGLAPEQRKENVRHAFALKNSRRILVTSVVS